MSGPIPTIGPFEFMMNYLQQNPVSNKPKMMNGGTKVADEAKTNSFSSNQSVTGNKWSSSIKIDVLDEKKSEGEHQNIWAIRESKLATFKCFDCEVGFLSQEDLELHCKSKTHAFMKAKRLASGASTFKCVDCGISFNSLENLKEHQKGKDHAFRVAEKLAKRVNATRNLNRNVPPRNMIPVQRSRYDFEHAPSRSFMENSMLKVVT